MNDDNKNTVVFIGSGSSYHIMMSALLSAYLPSGYYSYLICTPYSNEAIKWINTISFFDFIEYFPHGKPINKLSDIRLTLNFLISSNVKKRIRELSPTTLITFKDTDPISNAAIFEASLLNTRIVLIQDGLALYQNNPIFKFKDFWKVLFKFFFGYSNPWNYTQGMNPRVNFLAVSYPEMVPKIKIIGKQFIEIPSIPPPVRIIRDICGEKYHAFDDTLSRNSNLSILYIGQPLSELSLIADNIENNFLIILNDIILKNNYKFIIKPHPRDNPEKYFKSCPNAKIIDAAIPVEILAGLYDTDLIITPWSSAASNIALWYGRTVIYVHRLLTNRDIELIDFPERIIVNNVDDLISFLHDFNLKNKQYEKKIFISNQKFADQIYKKFAYKIIDFN